MEPENKIAIPVDAEFEDLPLVEQKKEIVKKAVESGAIKDRRHLAPGAGPEQMRRMHEIRMQMIKDGNEKAKGGRPKQPTKTQAREAALKELEPKAIQVLRDQLDSEDAKIAQQAARILLEHKWGRPTQRQEVKQDLAVSSIRYETTALGPSLDAGTE